MTDKDVYLGLGGNIGDSLAVLQATLALIAATPEVKELEVSSFYETAPVSDIPQDDYLNAVCRLKTSLDAKQLLLILQKIEKTQGKSPKPKNAPRVIDIDILFFGSESHNTKDLEIPHPRWRERLFVIVPLLDLTTMIVAPRSHEDKDEEIIDLVKLMDTLSEGKPQRVLRLNRALSKESKIYLNWAQPLINV